MSLSYSLRLLCILIVVAGLMLALAQLALAQFAEPILRHLNAVTARRRERILYLLQIGPALLSVFVAVVLCLPAYLWCEPHGGNERVSLVCVMLAAGLGLWFASALLRGLRLALRTLRFAHRCRRSGLPLSDDRALVILAVPDPGRPVALIGFFRPLVLVSDAFVRVARGVHPDAFALALAHERAHVAHRDNWKLLTLSLLPRLPRFLAGGDPWRRHWQTAADWAADDDAVRGEPARALLLAGILVQAARSVHGTPPPVLSSALTSAETNLAARVHRLTNPSAEPAPAAPSILPNVAALAGFAAAAILVLSPWIYSLSEWLLHLGAA